MRRLPIIAASLLTLVSLSACFMAFEPYRHEAARRVGMAKFMYERVIKAEPFYLTAFERVYDRDAEATLYIEGDGMPWSSDVLPSTNPTPKNPIALRLAAMDGARNVIHLSRPCQYTSWMGEGDCPERYWTTHRTSPDVMRSYNTALDELKTRWGITAFNLVGYDGGAAVAALLAADRKDVKSLRTVAGILDYKTFTAMHKVQPFDGSLDPIDVAPKLADLPQRHFIGRFDQVTPAAIYHSYAGAVGSERCLSVSIIDEADHERGWEERWRNLLEESVLCTEAQPKPRDAEDFADFGKALSKHK